MEMTDTKQERSGGGIGLTFAGGGGKGAYQIGVWKYLREIGLEKKIEAVSGTSVGALNAALFAAGEYRSAERIWQNMAPEQVLTLKTLEEKLSFRLPEPDGEIDLPDPGSSLKLEFKKDLLQWLNTWKSDGLISQEGLRDIIASSGAVEKIVRGSMPCFVTCTEVEPEVRCNRFDLRNHDSGEAEKLLLATAAIPYVFDPVEVMGKSFYDGGISEVGDNVPVAPLFRIGMEKVIAVYLKTSPDMSANSRYREDTVEIIPSESIGNFFTGTLNFTKEHALELMEFGYLDAKERYGDQLRALLQCDSHLDPEMAAREEERMRSENG